jgi:hypothetical protein
VWRVVMLAALASAQTMSARACPTSHFARFDFGRPSGIKYTGTEEVKYFIGKALTFRLTPTEPTALIRVLKEYGKTESTADHLVPRLPDLVVMRVPPTGDCTFYMLSEGDVGVFAYYEKDDVLWLVWESGPF